MTGWGEQPECWSLTTMVAKDLKDRIQIQRLATETQCERTIDVILDFCEYFELVDGWVMVTRDTKLAVYLGRETVWSREEEPVE